MRRAGWTALAGAGALFLTTVLLRDAATSVRIDDPRGRRGPQPVRSEPLPVPADWAVGWNRTAFVQDNVWTAGRRQYVVWVGPSGLPHVGKRELPSGRWETFDLATIPGNPLATPTAQDVHNVYALSVDADGFVHVSGNMHASRLRYVRSRWPGSITDWVAVPMVGSDEESVSYPAFVRRPDGGLLFFYRAGDAGGGAVIVNALEAGASAWSRLSTLLDGRTEGDSPYLQHIAVNPRDGGVELMYLWRHGHGAESNDDVSYLRSPDGGRTWLNSRRDRVTLPLTRRSSEVVHRVGPGSVLLNSGGFTVDDQGRPHAAFFVRSPEGKPVGQAVRHVWFDGDRWHVRALDDPGGLSGRPTLVPMPAGGVGMLWAGRRGPATSDLLLLRLTGGRGEEAVRLLSAPVGRWEVTYDTTALTSGLLHLLAPQKVTGEKGSVTASVVTFDLAVLHSVMTG